MINFQIKVEFVGDCALQINIYPRKNIDFKKITEELKKLPEIKDLCFAYETLTIFFDPLTTDAVKLKRKVNIFLQNNIEHFSTLSQNFTFPDDSPSLINIPACFCRECALDCERVENYTNMPFREFIEKYINTTYKVLFIGFQPGFPFLEGLHPQLHIPRLITPRIKVSAGSIGIGGSQTGIYTFSTPGGWNIIGKTPMKLFDFKKGALIKAGYSIKFYISECKINNH